MPNRRKPARLYLRKRRGRPDTWVILDGTHETSTGCAGADLQGAQEFFAEWLAQNTRPDTSQRHLDKVSIAEVLQLYGQDIGPGSASRATIGYHLGSLGRFWGSKTLAEVRGRSCRDYAAERGQAGCKAATARRELKTLQAAINHWHQESPLEAVPRVTLPPEGQARQVFLERSEAARLLQACRKRNLPHVARFIIIGIYTGTRHRAILGLRWHRALVGGSVDLARGIVYRRGETERETKKRRPPVVISGRLLGFMARWQRMDREAGNERVIHWNHQPVANIRRAFQSAVTEAGLPRTIVPHALRHTCACWLLWEGKSCWEVAQVLGATEAEVDRVYGHHRLAMQERKRA